MSSKIFKPLNKVMGAIGLVDEEDEEVYEEIDDEVNEVEIEHPEIVGNRKSKVVSIKTSTIPKVTLKKSAEFSDIMEVVDLIKQRRIVVVSFTDIEPKLAQRMIDYVVGACYALNGYFEEISKYIYLVAPENVEINNELKQELNKSNFFSFNG